MIILDDEKDHFMLLYKVIAVVSSELTFYVIWKLLPETLLYYILFLYTFDIYDLFHWIL